jgi:riboflavin synthase
VAAVDGSRFTVSLIPETLKATAASAYRAGTAVNVETDVLAKYQESIAEASGRAGGEREEPVRAPGLTLARLKELGFTE